MLVCKHAGAFICMCLCLCVIFKCNSHLLCVCVCVQASTPQELRLFYESNRTLLPRLVDDPTPTHTSVLYTHTIHTGRWQEEGVNRQCICPLCTQFADECECMWMMFGVHTDSLTLHPIPPLNIVLMWKKRIQTSDGGRSSRTFLISCSHTVDIWKIWQMCDA